MKDPQELVLEAALREVHRDEDQAPDLADRIGAAWRRGERGTGVEGLAVPRPSVEQESEHVRPRHTGWWVAAAAAALIAGTLAVRALVSPTAQPEPPVVAGQGAGAGPRLVLDLAPFELELSHGGRVQGQSAVLTLETGRVQLEHGAVDIVAPPEMPLLVSSAAGSILFAPGARGEVRVDLDMPLAGARRLLALPAEERARELTWSAASYPRWMTFEIAEGSAWIVKSPSEGYDTALPGRHYAVSEGGALSGPIDDTTSTRGQELVSRLLGVNDSPWSSLPFGTSGDDTSTQWQVALGAFLDRHPYHWPLLRMQVRTAFEAPGENLSACARTVRFLVSQPSEPALALARELWLLAPDLFTYEHQVVLAERGAFEFEREIPAIVDFEPGAELSAYLLPAARLALQGDSKGKELLRRILELPFSRRSDVFQTLIAARCLSTPEEPEVWISMRAGLLLEIEAALQLGWRDRAALYAAAIDHFDSRKLELDKDDLGATLQEVGDHCRLQLKMLGAAGELEQLLDALRNRD